MSHMMQHGLGDCPPGCYKPEPPADITGLLPPDGPPSAPVEDPGTTAAELPAPVPVGVRIVLKTGVYLLAILLVAIACIAVLGVLIRVVSWALGFE